MEKLNTTEKNIRFEIWGNSYELVLNTQGYYNLYRVYSDKKRRLFNAEFDASFNTMEEVRKYVLEHDIDSKKLEESERQEIKAGSNLIIWILLADLIGFAGIAYLILRLIF